MKGLPSAQEIEFTALMIAPDRDLAEQFFKTLPATRAFQVLGDLKSYPPRQTLDMRLRQLCPDVVLLDTATSLPSAEDLIRLTAGFKPVTHLVALHTHNDPETLVRVLRCGASEFLYAPFDPAAQKDALRRVRRLRQPEASADAGTGRLLVVTSTKPGSGSSTLAVQMAFALRRETGQRVLLVDLDLAGGTIGFYLKLRHEHSTADALAQALNMDPAIWTTFVVSRAGVDVLLAPEMPPAAEVGPDALHGLLEYARLLYDWVVLDVPSVPHRASLLAASESDLTFLVSTTELTSLHLTRKAVVLLDQLGFGKDRYRLLINRADKRERLGQAQIEKIVGCPVHAAFVNDYFGLQSVMAHGQVLEPATELGGAVARLATWLGGLPAGARRRSGHHAGRRVAC